MEAHKSPILTGDVSRALGVSNRRIQQLESEGILRAVRTPGGTRLFDPDQIEAVRLQRERQKELRQRGRR